MPEAIEKKHARYFVTRNQDGGVSYNGVDKGGPGTVIAENDQALVVRWPAGKHWVGRGVQPAYHPSSTDVLQKDEDGRFTLLISWDNRKAKGGKTKQDSPSCAKGRSTDKRPSQKNGHD